MNKIGKLNLEDFIHEKYIEEFRNKLSTELEKFIAVKMTRRTLLMLEDVVTIYLKDFYRLRKSSFVPTVEVDIDYSNTTISFYKKPDEKKIKLRS